MKSEKPPQSYVCNGVASCSKPSLTCHLLRLSPSQMISIIAMISYAQNFPELLTSRYVFVQTSVRVRQSVTPGFFFHFTVCCPKYVFFDLYAANVFLILFFCVTVEAEIQLFFVHLSPIVPPSQIIQPLPIKHVKKIQSRLPHHAKASGGGGGSPAASWELSSQPRDPPTAPRLTQ